MIRTNRERTADVCCEIAQKQMCGDLLDIICVRPFFAAVRKTFALGAFSKSRWLLAIDADVLLYREALSYIKDVARYYDSKELFRIDFKVDDKFRGAVCAGVHLYKNAWSEEMFFQLENDPNAGDRLREESDNVVMFCRSNLLDYHLVKPDYAVGWHDCFQFYRDIIRKYRRRYQRCLVDQNLEKVEESIKKKRSRDKNDLDYSMALIGLRSATKQKGDTSDRIMARLRLSEKPPLSKSGKGKILDALSDVSPPWVSPS